jgi:hypothetical protein
MVASIRYWMKAFNILTIDDQLSDFARKLLADEGYDPYLEDEASLWLLHYQLVKNGFATAYSIVFNELRREKIEFTRENFIGLVKRKAESEKSFAFNEKTLHDDFAVLTKMYLRSQAQTKDKEDSFSGLLTELDLITYYGKRNEEVFSIENKERSEVPDEVILYAILDQGQFDTSISLNKIEQASNGAGMIFALSRQGLQTKIENLVSKYSFITFNDHAGVKELQFKKKPLSSTILEKYYAN